MLGGAPRVVVALCVSVWLSVVTTASGVGDTLAQGTRPAENGPTPWTLRDLLPSLVDLGTGRLYENGQAAFRKGACGGCHAFAKESDGSGYAPDLTGVSAKFSRDIILQSILEPSAEISPNFGQTTFTLKDGGTITGTVVDQDDTRVVIAPVLLAVQATVEIPRANIASEEMSDVSAMPPGLVSLFTREEVVDLMAFLESGGDRTAPVYRKK